MASVLYAEPIGAQGGMGGYNEALVRALLAAAHTVTVVSSDATRLPDGCRYHPAFRRAVDRSRGRLTRLAAYAASMTKVVWLGLRNEVVVWHFSAVPPIDLVALRVLRAGRRRVVVVVHDPRPLSRVVAPGLQHHVTAAASLVVVHGPAARDELSRRMNGRATEVFIASHGDFSPTDPVTRAEGFAALGIVGSSRGPVCAVIGNLKPGKGTDRVLASVPALRAAGYQLLVAGSPQSNEGLAERVRLASAHGGVLSVLRRLTDQEEHAAYSLSAVVLAVYDEGFSSGVIATAHALNRPVVMTDVGDLASQAVAGDVVLPPSWRPTDLVSAVARASRCVSGDAPPADGVWAGPWRNLASAIVAES